ncbi:hypothetical protein R1flu_027550 [Riccia fluitans]|uniref:Cytochrome P450 n=1 Tax=Riccia fluitans TaxID=41844 RepID=A0ABD1XJ45_9MARC
MAATTVGLLLDRIIANFSTEKASLWTSIMLGLMVLIMLACLISWQRTCTGGLPEPPFSKGWPLIGETIHFAFLENTADFVRRRVERHGGLFRANLFLKNQVMVVKPDLLKLMLTDPQRLLKSNLPSFAQMLLGKDAVTALHGKAHSTMYALFMRSMSTRFHENWIAGFDEVIKRTVDSWKGRTMNCYGEGSKLFANTAFVYMFGTFNSDNELAQKLTQWNREIRRGLMSLGLYIPGTGYIQGLKARKNIDQFLEERVEVLLKQREGGLKRQFPSSLEFLLDSYRAEAGREMNPNDKNSIIGVRNFFIPIFDQIEVAGILFAWIMKYLSDFPDILQKVKAEQDEIAISKNGPDYKLTPEDLEKMKYSYQMDGPGSSSTNKVQSDSTYKRRVSCTDV